MTHPGLNDRIEVHTFYVAHCAECGASQCDGEEFRSTAEEAVEHVLERDWIRVDGRLLCDICHPIDWEEEPNNDAYR